MAQGSDFLPVDRIVAIAASTLKDVSPADRVFFKEWIAMGLQQIGPSDAWISEPKTLYPTELSFRKPSDMYEVIDIALFDVSGAEIKYTYRGQSKRIHVSNNSTLQSGQYAPVMGATVDLSEDAYYFHMGSNGSSVAYAQVVYWKFPTDEDGEMLISEKLIFALTMFIQFMMALRNNDKTGIGQMKNLWTAAKNEARNEQKMPSMLVMDEVARTWNSMIKKIRFRDF